MAEMMWDMVEKAMKEYTIVRNEPPKHMPDVAIRVIKTLSAVKPWEGQREVIIQCDYETSRRISAALMAISIEREVHIGAYEAEISSCAPFIGCRYSEEDDALTLFVDDEFCKEFTPATVQEIDDCNAWDDFMRREVEDNG